MNEKGKTQENEPNSKGKITNTSNPSLDPEIIRLREQLLKKQQKLVQEVQNQEPEIFTSSQEYSSQIEQVILFLRQFQQIVNQIIKENQGLQEIIEDQERYMDYHVQQFQEYLIRKEEKFTVLTETLSGYKHVNEILIRIITELGEDIEWDEGQSDGKLTNVLLETDRLQLLYDTTNKELEAERERFQKTIDHYEQHLEQQQTSLTSLYMEKIGEATEAKEIAIAALGEENIVRKKAESELKLAIGQKEEVLVQLKEVQQRFKGAKESETILIERFQSERKNLFQKITNIEKDTTTAQSRIYGIENKVNKLAKRAKEQEEALLEAEEIIKTSIDSHILLKSFDKYLEFQNNMITGFKRPLFYRIFKHLLNTMALDKKASITPETIAKDISLTPSVVYAELKDLEEEGIISFEKKETESSFFDYPIKIGQRK